VISKAIANNNNIIGDSDSHVNSTNDGQSCSSQNETTTQRKRNIQTIATDNDGGTILLQLATVVDIYGTASDIIGRRSFGGFHKSIGNTWDSAYKSRMEAEAHRSCEAKISDEELLRRYERYVKRGREKSGLNDEKKRQRKTGA
jgi:hypothetical protein